MLNDAGAGFLLGLDAALREALLHSGTTRAYPAGRLVHSRGDPGAALYVVLSGSVQLSVAGLDGARIISAVLGEGEAFGALSLFTDLPRSHDCEAVGRTQLRIIRRQDFRILLDSRPVLRDHVLEFLARRLAAALESVDDERRLLVPERVAKFLLQNMSPDGDVLISQGDIADRMGVSRYAVTLALRELRSARVIATGYRSTRIRNIPALRRCAGANRL